MNHLESDIDELRRKSKAFVAQLRSKLEEHAIPSTRTPLTGDESPLTSPMSAGHQSVETVDETESKSTQQGTNSLTAVQETEDRLKKLRQKIAKQMNTP